MMKHASALILLAAVVAPAPAFAQTIQASAPAAATAPAPKIAAKRQVGLPAPRRTAKGAPSLKSWSLENAGNKNGAQTAAVQKAGPALPPAPRIKVPKTKAPQTRSADRSKKPRVNAASVIASTVRQQTRN